MTLLPAKIHRPVAVFCLLLAACGPTKPPPMGIEDATADVEQLEAQAHGARAKYLVWRRAGDAWSAAGLPVV